MISSGDISFKFNAWLSEEQLKLLSVMTKDDSYRKILYDEDGNKAEVKTMCEVADRLKNEGNDCRRT